MTIHDSSQATFAEWLHKLVAIPTVSADPAHHKDIQQGVDLVIAMFEHFGFTAKTFSGGGNPAVFAEKIGDPSWPTVLLYNHMDVQPADAAEWASPPFELQIADDTYTGRGATDDKGPALTALLAAHSAIEQGVQINIKFIWEFEEEIGSPTFADILQQHAQELAADAVLVSDTIWISSDKPAIPYGLRGLITFELSLRTAETDVHSGLAGGVARNPISELCALVAQCYDPTTGTVLVPGFYDGITPPTEEEIAGFTASGFSLQQFIADHHLTHARSLTDTEAATRIMAEPTFEVHSILGGYTGTGVKTVIPPAATAKVSCRLVPGQDPATVMDKIRTFVHSLNPAVTFEPHAQAAPYVCSPDSPYIQAMVQACTEAGGIAPALVREGGSIGAVLALEQHLNAPVVMLGLSLPEHGYHAPNEHFDWQQASFGIRVFSQFFTIIAEN